MTISAAELKTLSSRWVSLSADHPDLKQVTKYVSIDYLRAKGPSGMELLCKECDEIAFFEGNDELFSRKGSGKIKLPLGIKVTVYRGMYLEVPL